MSRNITTTVYTYDELSEEAQAKARDWFREGSAGDDFWSEHVTDDFKDVLKAAGFALDSRHGRDALYWSGFWSQGSGACFSATWRADDVNVAALLKDRPVFYADRDGEPQTCPSNAALVPLLERAQNLAVEYPRGSGTITGNDRGHTTRCDDACADRDSDLGDNEPDWTDSDKDDALAHDLGDLARNLANYFYRSLEREYEYQHSDEIVAENITANEYEFTEEGARA
jgi:hypothetical protein